LKKKGVKVTIVEHEGGSEDFMSWKKR
jgi:hypothetical protein